MNELLREIEEDIRRERYQKLWNSFGKLMVAASIAVIVATIIIVIVQNNRQEHAMERTALFIKGVDRMNIEDYNGAIPIFTELAADESSTYYGMAMARKAQAQVALNDHEAAAKTYAALAQHDKVLGELAKMMENQKAEPLVEPAKGSPFFFTQSEWKGWQLMQAGKKDEAVSQFLSLYENTETPYSLRERMAEVLQHVAPDKLHANAAEAKETAHE